MTLRAQLVDGVVDAGARERLGPRERSGEARAQTKHAPNEVQESQVRSDACSVRRVLDDEADQDTTSMSSCEASARRTLSQ